MRQTILRQTILKQNKFILKKTIKKMKNYGNLPLTKRQLTNKRYYEDNKIKIKLDSSKKYKTKADKIKLDDALKLVMEKMGGLLKLNA